MARFLLQGTLLYIVMCKTWVTGLHLQHWAFKFVLKLVESFLSSRKRKRTWRRHSYFFKTHSPGMANFTSPRVPVMNLISFVKYILAACKRKKIISVNSWSSATQNIDGLMPTSNPRLYFIQVQYDLISADILFLNGNCKLLTGIFGAT